MNIERLTSFHVALVTDVRNEGVYIVNDHSDTATRVCGLEHIHKLDDELRFEVEQRL